MSTVLVMPTATTMKSTSSSTYPTTSWKETDCTTAGSSFGQSSTSWPLPSASASRAIAALTCPRSGSRATTVVTASPVAYSSCAAASGIST